MASISLAEITKILENDIILFKEVTKFSDALSVPAPKTYQLKMQIRMGVITVYDLFQGILSEWISMKGREATLQELLTTLKNTGFKNASDYLEELSKSYLSPVRIVYTKSSNSKNISQLEITFNICPVVLNFIGRSKELDELFDLFNSNRFNGVVVSGLGGIGKTELTKKFALDVKHSNQHLVKSWFSGETAQSLRTSLAKFCQHVQIRPTDEKGKPLDVDQMLENLKQAGINLRRWVIVIDNVDEVYPEFKSAVRKLISFGQCAFLLVTSRSRDIFPGELELLEVKEFRLDDSVSFVKLSLRIKTDLQDEAITTLCMRLGNLPLALTQAVAYIKQQRALSLMGEAYDVSHYLEELQNTEIAGMDMERELAEYPHTTLKVWNMTISKIESSGAEPSGNISISVLHILAFLNSDDISLELLQNVYKCFYNCEVGIKELDNALRLLVKYSLIRSYNKVISIHRLVQLVVRLRLEHANKTEKAEAGLKDTKVERLLLAFWVNFKAEQCNQSGMTHVISIWNHAIKYPEIINSLCDKCGSIYHRLDHWAMYSECSNFADANLLQFTRILGPNHPDTLRMEQFQGHSLMEKGEYEKALVKLKSVYEKQRVLFGDGHDETIATIHYIMTDLINLGGWQEIVEYCNRIIDQQDVSCGEKLDQLKEDVKDVLEGNSANLDLEKTALDVSKLVVAFLERDKENQDEDSITTKTVLAAETFGRGEYEEARSMSENILKLSTNLYGPDHPETLLTKSLLASSCLKLGKIDKAKAIFQEILETREKLLGLLHPDTLQTRHDFATCLEAEENWPDAREMFADILKSREILLGADHRRTLDTKRELAITTAKLGDRETSLEMHHSILAVRVKDLGSRHPDTLVSKRDIAICLSKMGDFEGALNQFKEILEFELSEGVPEVDILNTKSWIASTLSEQAEHAEALNQFQEILSSRENLLGETHVDTMTTRQGLATCHYDLENYIDARPMFESLLKLREEILGADHPDTLNSKSYLANTLNELGLKSESLKVNQELLIQQEKVFGQNHPDTLETLRDIGVGLFDQGDFSAARDSFQRSLDVQVAIEGEDHPGTLATKSWLADSLMQLRVHKEALEIYKDVLATRIEKLGEDQNSEDSLKMKQDIAHCHFKVGNMTEAHSLLKSILQIQEEALGIDHVDTVETRSRLAKTLAELDCVEEALQIHNEILQVREATLNKEPLDILKTRRNIANCHYKNKNYTVARDMYAEVLAMANSNSEIGADHRYTLATMCRLAETLRKIGNNKDSLELFQSLVVKQRNVLGEEHPNTISSENSIKQLNNLSQAEISPPTKRFKE